MASSVSTSGRAGSGALPVDFPDVLRLDIGCFGKRRFQLLARVDPDGTDFEQLDALALSAKPQVGPAADRVRWTARQDEPVDGFFDPFVLKIR